MPTAPAPQRLPRGNGQCSRLVVDGDDVTVRFGEGERSPERPVDGRGHNRHVSGDQLVVPRLSVVGMQPQRHAGPGPGPNSVGRTASKARPGSGSRTANDTGSVAYTTAPGGLAGAATAAIDRSDRTLAAAGHDQDHDAGVDRSASTGTRTRTRSL